MQRLVECPLILWNSQYSSSLYHDGFGRLSSKGFIYENMTIFTKANLWKMASNDSPRGMCYFLLSSYLGYPRGMVIIEVLWTTWMCFDFVTPSLTMFFFLLKNLVFPFVVDLGYL